ncbi:MAG: hypothetical protein HY552_04870 [Elusimicrobia bacterium]|nr:hypothetical protein [Elusimicrobiota bacterium]
MISKIWRAFLIAVSLCIFWTPGNTEGIFPDFPESISANDAIIENALYFRSPWKPGPGQVGSACFIYRWDSSKNLKRLDYYNYLAPAEPASLLWSVVLTSDNISRHVYYMSRDTMLNHVKDDVKTKVLPHAEFLVSDEAIIIYWGKENDIGAPSTTLLQKSTIAKHPLNKP